jgi:GWxTD domain-containing protein
MRRILTLFLIAFSTQLFSMSVTFHYGVFMTPEKSTYVETYLMFNGADLKYNQDEDSLFQAQVEVTLMFIQNNEILDYSKTIVKSQKTTDAVNSISDFIDQQRFEVSPGNYELKIVLKDVHNPTDSVSSIQDVDVRMDPNSLAFSDIMLVGSTSPAINGSVFERGGLNLYPKISPFYSNDLTELQFYSELYNANEKLGNSTPFLVSIEIVSPNTDEVVGQFRSIQRKNAAAVHPILQRINITDLPTGSYVLMLKAVDRNNEVLSTRSLPFKRFNQSDENLSLRLDPSETFVGQIPEDSLRLMCNCLIYKGTDAEVNYISNNYRKAEYSELQRFFYAFWQDRNAMDPESEWRTYYQDIAYAEDRYGNNTQHGCGTDRGRIYLKFGKPNSMSIVRSESRAYPYEIWHYYKIPEKSNAKFFFLDTKRTDEYILAHSNVLGEPYDQLWYTRLVRETMGGSQSSQERSQEVLGSEGDPYSHGSRALDYWNNPR